MLKSLRGLTQQLKNQNKIQFFFSQQQQFNNHYDVIVSGAGPVGTAVACALQKENYFKNSEQNNVLLLDIFQPPKLDKVFSKDTPDHRVVSLSQSSVQFLKSVGAWQHMKEDRMGLVKQIQVWENRGQGFIQFDEKIQQNGLGYINYVVENNHIQGALMQEIYEQGKVDCGFGTKILNYKRNPENGNLIEVELENGQTVTTNLIIGSEGRNSAVKKLANIETNGWPYHQKGIVCSIKLSIDDNFHAYQRYLESGPIAILPLWDDFCSIVWSVKNEDHDYLIGLSSETFLNELNHALQSRPKQETPTFDIAQEQFHFAPLATEICNKRLSFPLIQAQAKNYVADGVALVGDAAHSIHPQGGQGLNMGLLDAVSISNNIIQNLRTGNNIGQEISLKGYEVEAKSYNYLTAASMEFFQQIYGVNNSQFSFLRNLGVNVINNLEPLKRQIQQSASFNPLAPQEYLWEQN